MKVEAPITHMKAGRIRTIALTSETRSDMLPDVPTVAEAGVPGFAVENWYGFSFPAGTPKTIVAIHHREINRILALPDVKERLYGLGIVPFPTRTPEEFGAYASAVRRQAIRMSHNPSRGRSGRKHTLIPGVIS